MKEHVGLACVRLKDKQEGGIGFSIYDTCKITQDNQRRWTGKEKDMQQETAKITLSCKRKAWLKTKE